jgi:hypothetical protein
MDSSLSPTVIRCEKSGRNEVDETKEEKQQPSSTSTTGTFTRSSLQMHRMLNYRLYFDLVRCDENNENEGEEKEEI